MLFISSITLAYEDEIKSLTKDLSAKIVGSGQKVVAVVDFADLQGNVTELGRFLAEELSISLAASGNGFEVVDRNQLKSLLQEQKLSLTGLIDPATMKKVGQISGADALITGTVTPFGDTVRLGIKVLNTETAKLISGGTVNIAKTKAIEELLGNNIKTVGEPGTQTPTPTTAKKEEVNGIMFEVKDCTISGTSLICNLIVTVTNNGNDKTLKIYKKGEIGDDGLFGYMTKTEAYDASGNQYSISECQLGNAGYKLLLVSGVSTQLKLIFANVSKNLNRISLLQVNGRADKDFIIKFRDLPLQ
jgi:TolB-like protein